MSVRTRTRDGCRSAGKPAMSCTRMVRRSPRSSRGSTSSSQPVTVSVLRSLAMTGAATICARPCARAKPRTAANIAPPAMAAALPSRQRQRTIAARSRAPAAASGAGSKVSAKYVAIPQPSRTGAQRNQRSCSRSSAPNAAAKNCPMPPSSRATVDGHRTKARTVAVHALREHERKPPERGAPAATQVEGTDSLTSWPMPSSTYSSSGSRLCAGRRPWSSSP